MGGGGGVWARRRRDLSASVEMTASEEGASSVDGRSGERSTFLRDDNEKSEAWDREGWRWQVAERLGGASGLGEEGISPLRCASVEMTASDGGGVGRWALSGTGGSVWARREGISPLCCASVEMTASEVGASVDGRSWVEKQISAG